MRADSDLGELPITVAHGALPAAARAEALAQGYARTRELRRKGLIYAAYLALQGEVRALLPGTTFVESVARRAAGQTR